MSKKTKKKIDQDFNDEDHENNLKKLKEKLNEISDEEDSKKKPNKNLFEIQDNKKTKKPQIKNKEKVLNFQKQSKFFDPDTAQDAQKQNMKQEKKEKTGSEKPELILKNTKKTNPKRNEKEESEIEKSKTDSDVEVEENFNEYNSDEELESDDVENESPELIRKENSQEKQISKKILKESKNKKEKKENKKNKNNKEEKELINEEEFKKALWEQIWLIAIIGIFFIMITFSKYYEEKYTKYARYMFSNKENFKDFYEILEIDSSASTPEIRQQYKKLAVMWHPDKNPDCGNPCQEKFQEIIQAYEVLGHDEKRRSYDEMLGVVAPIKSKTISLTEANFERLVLETNDVWIIQIYEDANPWCERIADLWDEFASEYSNTVKFGRINLGTQRNLVRFLPINIVFLPTILSMVKGYESEIFVLNRDFMNNMRKFLLHVIVSKFKFLNPEKFKLFYEQTNKTESNVPELLYIMRASTLPIDFKYYAFIVFFIFLRLLLII